MKKKTYLFVIFMSLLSGHCFSQVQWTAMPPPTFTVSCPDRVKVGDQFKVSFIVATLASSKFYNVNVDGFSLAQDIDSDVLLAGPYKSTKESETTTEGKYSLKRENFYTYVLCANNEKEIFIPQAFVNIDGKKYSTQAFTIHTSNQKSQEQPGMFIRPILSDAPYRVNQNITLEYWFYGKGDFQPKAMSKYMLTINPEYFDAEELKMNERNFEKEMLGGDTYYKVLLKRYNLKPKRSGDLMVGAFQFDFKYDKKKSKEDPLDAFFNVSTTIEETKTFESLAFSIQVRPEEAKKHTAAQGLGLWGNVKEVVLYKEKTIFDRKGNITAKISEDGNRTNYVYTSPTQYKIDENFTYTITQTKNSRIEKEVNGMEMPTEYVFDNQGRVIIYKYPHGVYQESRKYTYTGDNKYPDSMTLEIEDEEGTYKQIDKFVYLKFDDQGNWTQRKEICTTESTDYNYDDNYKAHPKTTITKEPTLTGNRVITYY